MASKVPGPRIIHITVTSDIICPWCYVGWKEMQRAIARAESQLIFAATSQPIKFNVEYRPFILDTALQEGVMGDKVERWLRKSGEQKYEDMKSNLREHGEALGITFVFEGPISQTTDAHRILLRVYQLGGQSLQQPLLRLLFSAYFEQAGDVFTRGALAKFAADAGVLTQQAALEFLVSPALDSEVRSLVSSAREMGVKGIPFTVIDGQWAISGSESADFIYTIFEKLAKGETP